MKQTEEAVRLMKRTMESPDCWQVLTVFGKFQQGTGTLGDYDHQAMKRPKGNYSAYALSYKDCRQVIDQMKYGKGPELFGSEKEDPLWCSVSLE